ncbi:MAG TPA: response regulator [Candidatus Atopostipes pullistercoris]|uniref:Response regulator n=1 Tax=Candidatus Atopostipes pullistercoris TaxID=2838467 RepID=A0A9D2JYU1_9LACT|nr:response regulator [Candidatus Atopostipes pullistercoris]
MYSIILVDDERSLRESIEHIVDWEGNGFHLIGTAQNGLDALELMENDHVPDVVITDIKMPVMDGIELAKKLRDEYPTIKIVFLSGYDEFQYAVEGIRLNVVSYLLKPISKDEIENCLNDLKNTLDEEIQAVNDMSRISGEYQKNLELMKISFLNSLLTEERFEGINNELEEVLKTHELEFFNRGKILFTIRFVENQA